MTVLGDGIAVRVVERLGCATSAWVPSTIASATDRCGLVANTQGNHRSSSGDNS
jgi:hypothetical protein